MLSVLGVVLVGFARLGSAYHQNGDAAPRDVVVQRKDVEAQAAGTLLYEPQLMQLYYAGLPVLLAHLKATRPRRSPFGTTTASPASSPGRSLTGDVVNFNLFDTALPHYTMPGSPVKAVATS